MREASRPPSRAIRAAWLCCLVVALGCAGPAEPSVTKEETGASVADATGDGTAASVDGGTVAGADADAETGGEDTGLADTTAPDVAVQPRADTHDADADEAIDGAETADLGDADGGGDDDAQDGPAADGASADQADADQADADQADADQADADEVDAGGVDPDVADADDADAVAASDAATAVDAGADPDTADGIGPLSDPSSLPAVAFTDITATLGIDPKAIHQPCVAAADFDGDGDDDFVVVEMQGKQPVLQAHLLGPGGKVVASPFKVTLMQPNFGCTPVDLDADGHTDLLFGGFSGLSVYLGDGKGGFTDASATWLPYILDFDSFNVTPADLDGDGDLDLFVGAGFAPPACTALKCAYTASDLLCSVDPPVPNLNSLQDRVLIQGAAPPLVDATAQWKVPGGGTQTVTAAMDVDDDGKVDILVADDFGSARVLHNIGGAFASYATEIGLAAYSGAMGWTVGDFDGDGLPDLVIAESGPTPVYRRLTQPPTGLPFAFEDIGGKLGSWNPMWTASSWSPIAEDFDHDGRQDLLVANASHVTMDMTTNPTQLCAISQSAGMGSLFASLPSIDVLLLAQPDGTMAPHKLPAGAYAHIIIVGQRALDIDGDGDLDLVQTRPGPGMLTSLVRVLRNDLPKKGGSVRIRLVGKGGNLDALGARVTLSAAGKAQVRWLYGAGSFGGTAARVAHFGLGTATAASSVEVRWPDGQLTQHGPVAAGATLTLTWP